jgi:hypothetical protein
MKRIIVHTAVIALATAMWSTAQDTKAPSSGRIASSDGKRSGVLARYSPLEITNADKLNAIEQAAAKDVFITQMGTAKPEWGIYDPAAGGAMIAIGYCDLVEGTSHLFRFDGATPAVFRFGKRNSFGGFSFEKGAIYSIGQTNEGTGPVLLSWSPAPQKLLSKADAVAPESKVIGVEAHHSPPEALNTSKVPFSATAAKVAAAVLVQDGICKPEWGIYESAPDGALGALLAEGEMSASRNKLSTGSRRPDLAAFVLLRATATDASRR